MQFFSHTIVFSQKNALILKMFLSQVTYCREAVCPLVDTKADLTLRGSVHTAVLDL